MNIYRTSRNVTIIALLLSLLFHLSTVFYLFMQKKAHLLNNADQLIEQQKELEKVQKRDEWVETKSRSSHFGAPVFFQDEPTQDERTEEASEDVEEDPSENLEIEPQAQKISSQLHTEIIEQKPIAAVKKRIRRKKKSQPQKRNTQSPPVHNAQKPPLSLAQLTQGFLNHIKDEGKYSVSMLGKKTGLPSAQQMQYERYLQKLQWQVENSFRIHQSRAPLMAIAKDTTIHIFLALHQNGTIKQLAISRPSGNTQLDRHMLFIIQDASSSFPPVPQALNPFYITWIFTDY